MKLILKRMLALIIIVLYFAILMFAVVYPFVLVLDSSVPVWTCFILYPITLIIMAGSSEIVKLINKLYETRKD